MIFGGKNVQIIWPEIALKILWANWSFAKVKNNIANTHCCGSTKFENVLLLRNDAIKCLVSKQQFKFCTLICTSVKVINYRDVVSLNNQAFLLVVETFKRLVFNQSCKFVFRLINWSLPVYLRTLLNFSNVFHLKRLCT